MVAESKDHNLSTEKRELADWAHKAIPSQTREAPGGQAELDDVSVWHSGNWLPGHEAAMTSNN